MNENGMFTVLDPSESMAAGCIRPCAKGVRAYDMQGRSLGSFESVTAAIAAIHAAW